MLEIHLDIEECEVVISLRLERDLQERRVIVRRMDERHPRARAQASSLSSGIAIMFGRSEFSHGTSRKTHVPVARGVAIEFVADG